jgi:hypothetical protein
MSKLHFSCALLLLAAFSLLPWNQIYGYGIGTGASSKLEAATGGSDATYLPNKIVIKFRDGRTFGSRLSKTGHAEFDNLLSLSGISRLEQMRKAKPSLHKRSSTVALESIYFAHFSGNFSPAVVAAGLKNHSMVEYAEPLRVYALDVVPNDPLFNQQAHLDIVGAEAAWNIVKGEQGNVVVAVVDGGTDIDHPDLAANIWINPGESGNGRESNNVDDDGNGFVDDFRGWNFANNSNDPSGLAATPTSANHGAHVAGIIGAVTDNGNQVSGISWNAKVMAINSGFATQDNAIAFGYEGLLYAAENGADIVNLSWGGAGPGFIFEQDIVDFARDMGVIVVAAAGNGGSFEPHFPSSYTNAFSVAATEAPTAGIDVKAGFSNYGPTVDIAAPGVGIRSTFHNGVTGLFSGTSQASPLVAGVLALVKTQHPDWSMQQLIEQVRVTTDNIDAANPGTPIGSGRVNAMRAVSVTNLPSIRIADVRFVDANGNEVIEKSEAVEVRMNLINYLAPASNVNLTLTEFDPFVTITSANATISSLGTLETTTTPISFSFNTTSSAPTGRRLDFVLELSSGDYQDKERFSATVQPRFENMNVNNIEMSLSGIGRLGFATTEAPEQPIDGVGFVYRFIQHYSLLFEGAVIAGTGPANISNAARGIGQAQTRVFDRDFQTTADGPLRISWPGALTDQETYTVFEDIFSSTPMNLRVTQESFAMSDAPNGHFILLRYTLENGGQNALTNLHFGLYFDWDLGTSGQQVVQNLASYDPARRLGIVSSQGILVGAMALSPNAHYRAINNNDINDTDGFTDAEKWQAISGGTGVNTAGPADVSNVIANGPFGLQPGATVTVDYALVAATTLNDLRVNADAAAALWNQLFVTGVEEEPVAGIPGKFALGQNYPNPFNPSTEIRYELAQSVEVELRIFNLLGQEIRTLFSSRQLAGFHSRQWDGKNDSGEAVASGLYLYELRAGDFVATRKMLLLR